MSMAKAAAPHLMEELRVLSRTASSYQLRRIAGQAHERLNVLDADLEILRSALGLTEDNLRRLIAARHCDEVLMSPWLQEVRQALYGVGSSGPERALERTSGRAIAKAGIDPSPAPSSQSQRESQP